MANYLGTKTIKLNDDQVGRFYSNKQDNTAFQLLRNQYLIIDMENGEQIGPFKWTGFSFEDVPYRAFGSYHIGEIKPKNNDPYQRAYMDSIVTNQFTIGTGPAGTGKSLIALAYAFQELSNRNINKIYIFTNPFIAHGAAKLGYYPGTKEDKLLDSQMGNILTSKLGSRMAIEQMIEKEQLIIVPMGDARGCETADNCFAYFTEAQNLDVYLMKLFLQRINDTTKVVIEGDFRQVDNEELFGNGRNGLRRAMEVYAGKDYFGHVELRNIYRSRIANDAEEMTYNVTN